MNKTPKIKTFRCFFSLCCASSLCCIQDHFEFQTILSSEKHVLALENNMSALMIEHVNNQGSNQ